MKSLRDQMLTSNGAYCQANSLDLDPELLQKNEEINEYSRQLAKQVKERNKEDQTWNVLTVPGYYQAAGPKEIYTTDCHRNFDGNPKILEAVSNICLWRYG